IGIMAQHFAGDLDTFVDREERALCMAVGHADHDPVKQPGGAAHQIFMAACQGIESSGINGSNHANSEQIKGSMYARLAAHDFACQPPSGFSFGVSTFTVLCVL